MPSPSSFRPYLILFTLVFLTLSAFVVRSHNLEVTHTQTTDELLYFRMGVQMSRDISDYNGRDFARIILEDHPEMGPVPAYFYDPLFKYPPLFTFLVSLAIKGLGVKLISAGYVSVLFGVMMIPLAFLLGRRFYGENVGAVSAFFVWLDPVHIICSQKIWLDTTVSFFTVLAVYFLLRGTERSARRGWFLAFGLSCGCAVLTKYSGVLGVLIGLVYALIYRRDLLRRWDFLAGLILPFVMLLPWFLWNYRVYGADAFLDQMKDLMELKGPQLGLLMLGCALLGLATGAYILLGRRAGRPVEQDAEDAAAEEGSDRLASLRKYVVWGYGALFLAAIFGSILNSLNPYFFPTTYSQGGHFQQPLFYFGRLIEFSLVYFFAFLAFFVPDEDRIRRGSLLYATVIVLMIFYLIWGNYQSRYILAATPFLIILGVKFWFEVLGRIGERNSWPSTFIRAAWVGLLVYVFLKTNYINFLVSYPNDMCYF